ncbi:hypothetical protein ACFW16_24740 [Inquilinus sp. NPDC058860]|uniref:hypothetical protein n=1 Tax=Inquilinus sp. NPDC058860 TaxID=3346652 RepID=UPI00367484C2
MALLIRLKGNAPRPDLPIVGVRGFPITDLVGLYCFDQNDTVGSIKNWAPGGAPTAAQTAGAAGDSAALMANGGIRLQATAHVPGPTIDMTQPWSAFWHGRIESPLVPGGPSPWTSGFITTTVTTTRGIVVFQTVGSIYPDASTLLAFAMRVSANGVQLPAVGTPGTAGLTYGAIGTLCLRFAPDSASTGTAEVLFVRGGAIVVRASAQVDIAAMTKDGAGNVVSTMKPVLGSQSPIYPRGSLAVETWGVYKRKLSDQGLATVDAAGAVIRQARSR